MRAEKKIDSAQLGTQRARGVPVYVVVAPRPVAWSAVAAAVLLAHVAGALVAVRLVPAPLAVDRDLPAVAAPAAPALARGAVRHT